VTPLARQAFLALSVLIAVGAGLMIDQWLPYAFGILAAYAGGELAVVISTCDAPFDRKD